MRTALIAALAVLVSPAAFATEVSVSFSDDFTTELQDNYGEREGEYLATEVREDIMRELEKAGVDVSRVDVTILDAKPSKPTMQQLGDKPGLSYMDSISIGGMKLSAIAYDASGNQTGELEYKWYENDLRNTGFTTWYDAKKASDRFARRFVDELN